MYKCCLDSGWVNVQPLTVLVGKNETGKTTLLKALHKFNPFSEEGFNIKREWPRGYRGQKTDSQQVCTAEFKLESEEIETLNQISAQRFYSDIVQVARLYNGEFEVLFRDGVFSEKDKELRADAAQYILSRLPTFVYMDEYRTFRGTALLDQVQQRRDKQQLTADDKTFLTTLELAKLDLDKLIEMGGEEDREDRQYDLDDAGAMLTGLIENRWGQKQYEVKFGTDGQQFFTWVKDTNERALIRLEERSRGFQWFFSFDLLFMHETQGTFKNCVLLLDEPAMYLHPEAQRDLLARLREYGKGNTLIYSTHLPFMVDLEEPDNIRIVSNKDGSAVVTEELSGLIDGTKLTLDAALAVSSRSTFEVSEKNLIVEDAADAAILSLLSNLLLRSGEPGLPADLRITPAGGAKEVTYLAAYMTGQRQQVIALYDTDMQGVHAKDLLVDKWLPRFSSHRTHAWDLAFILGVDDRDLSVEDLFPEKYYLEFVYAVYSKFLAFADISEINLPAEGPIKNRLAEYFDKYLTTAFDRNEVAKLLCESIAKMDSMEELPEGVAETARGLFVAITDCFDNPVDVAKLMKSPKPSSVLDGISAAASTARNSQEEKPSSVLNLGPANGLENGRQPQHKSSTLKGW